METERPKSEDAQQPYECERRQQGRFDRMKNEIFMKFPLVRRQRDTHSHFVTIGLRVIRLCSCQQETHSVRYYYGKHRISRVCRLCQHVNDEGRTERAVQ